MTASLPHVEAPGSRASVQDGERGRPHVVLVIGPTAPRASSLYSAA